MTAGQQVSWERNAQKYVINGLARSHVGSIFVESSTIDTVALFERKAPLVVEIGIGSGEMITAAALAYPEWDFIGFEVYEKVLGASMSRLAEVGVRNVKLILGDAVSGLEYLFAPDSVAQIWTFFPDPWQKKRHNKRRIINDAFTDLVVSRLENNGIWRLATDWCDYAQHIHKTLDFRDDLRMPTHEPNARFDTRPITRFEARAIAQKRDVTDFTYVKKSLSDGLDAFKGRAN
jgi:tRNA (guanine-N7-)-methyltransferase